MKLMSATALAVLGVVASILTGCDRASVAQTPLAAAATSASAGPVERVTVGKPVRKTLQRTTAQPGRIKAFEETPLYAKISAYVEEISVDIGDRVQKGQVLVKLWAPEMKDELTQKEALLAQAEAEVEQAQAAFHAAEAAAATAQARVNEAQAGVARAEGEYGRWKAEHSRMSELAAAGSVTRKLVDETLNQFRAADASREEAAARVESAKAGVKQGEAGVASAKADQAAAVARQRVAEANLAHAKTLWGYTEIKAPYVGVVTRRGVDTGHFVQPPSGRDGSPLLVVCHADMVRVFVDVPEMEASLVNVGDRASVQLQAAADMKVEGQITRTSWDLDPANRSLRVEIDLPNPEGRLRPGMYATAGILLEQRDDVLTLPATAIVRQAGETFCCAVETDKVRRLPVELGLRSGADIEIVSGLTGDEAIVLLRADTLKEGQAVEVIEAAGK